ncbi:hypothetical protein KCU71_g1559, partial [Aureobasidium melanogenum]
MANQDNTIVGLRAQILENWRYLCPYGSKPLIVISFKSHRYEAFIAEDNVHREIHKVSDRHSHVEQALRELLDWTSEMVHGSLKRDQFGRVIL